MKLSFRSTVVSLPALKQVCLLDTVEMGFKQKLPGKKHGQQARFPSLSFWRWPLQAKGRDFNTVGEVHNRTRNTDLCPGKT